MARAPRTAFVHIGAPKTGSTAIQVAFSAGAQSLSAAGYHYLEGDRNHIEALALCFWAEEDARNLAKLRWIDEEAVFARRRETLRDWLSEQIARSAPRHLVLSAENLCEFHDEEVASFLSFLREKFDRVRVIAYVREPLSWMTSAAQQATKWSGDTLDELFSSPRLPDFRNRFAPFIREVRPVDFDLRVYSSAPDFDVVTDFSAAIGLDPDVAAGLGTSRQNPALSHRSAMVLSAVNAHMPPFVDYRHNPCRAFDVVADCRLPGRAFSLPTETALAAAPILDAERDWLNHALGRPVFSQQQVPEIPLDAWFGGEREEIGEFAVRFAELARAAQNERAFRSLLHAKARRREHPERARKLLREAWLLSTDRWTMHLIATEAVETEDPERHRFFAKQRLMRRIEDPQTQDPPLQIGNPFDRSPARL